MRELARIHGVDAKVGTEGIQPAGGGETGCAEGWNQTLADF